ncbi:MAG TPA: ArsR family transcriptional regulator [Nitrosopumilaceae archaeon]|nr:ArsR family transcriptional regulator [Nitrosopumilaceae archaeon]
MAKGYQTQDLKQKLVEVLSNSKTGLSGVEISEKLGINRVTMTKYLNIFATEGLLHQKNIGNVNLWFIEEDTKQFEFPNDYFIVKTKYLELLTSLNEQKTYNLIRNCIHSNVNTTKLITQVIIPSIESIQELFVQGKISKSEEKLLGKIISNSLQMLNLIATEINPRKNVIIISADSKSSLISESASATFHSEGWKVSLLGDMSDSIDVIFDLDLQKFLGKVWTKKNGVMIIIIFSETNDGLRFFSQAVNSVKGKFGKNLNLILCSKIKKNSALKADLFADNLETVLQWSETTFERIIS